MLYKTERNLGLDVDMKKLDLTGQTFNRLTVLREVSSPEKDKHWLCQCGCGNVVEIRASAIKNGITKSCGCLAKETAKNLVKDNKLDAAARKAYDDKRVGGVATFLINNKPQKNTKTGYKGVLAYHLADGSLRYQAYLSVNKKHYSKKGFKTAEEAYQYRLKLVELHVPREDKR